jgi:hypothetical protein
MVRPIFYCATACESRGFFRVTAEAPTARPQRVLAGLAQGLTREGKDWMKALVQ